MTGRPLQLQNVHSIFCNRLNRLWHHKNEGKPMPFIHKEEHNYFITQLKWNDLLWYQMRNSCIPSRTIFVTLKENTTLSSHANACVCVLKANVAVYKLFNFFFFLKKALLMVCSWRLSFCHFFSGFRHVWITACLSNTVKSC